MLQNAEIPVIVRWLLFLVGELAWGFIWACCLDTEEGKWLARAHTWLTVVVGDGVALLLGLLVVPPLWIGIVVLGFTLASVGIIRRSLRQERQIDEALSGR